MATDTERAGHALALRAFRAGVNFSGQTVDQLLDESRDGADFAGVLEHALRTLIRATHALAVTHQLDGAQAHRALGVIAGVLTQTAPAAAQPEPATAVAQPEQETAA